MIQGILNHQALIQLEETYKIIKQEKDLIKKSNMQCLALREINNCRTCLDQMTEKQKILLDEKVLALFIEREYLIY